MRLADIYINGFGLFHNLKIEGLSPELTVFYGHNESGKSTFLGFLRAIFFGFPDGRSSENSYPPLAGGRHGGNITLVTNDQQFYVVERHPGPRGGKVDVLKPDQTHGGKAFLDRFLGMANRTLFKNIYAFSLSELQNFETLNPESVREALYSAGAGVDPNGLARLKSNLEKKESELFKRGGSKPKINAILSRLTNIRNEKKTLYGSIEEYDRIRSRISHLSEEIDAYEEKKLEISIQLKKREQWLNIWPDWINLSLTQKKLDELEAVDHFPPHGLNRFESLKARLEDSQNELLGKEEDLKRQGSELSTLKTDPVILNQASPIRSLRRDQGHFEAVVRDLSSVRQELANGERKLNESLNRLGPLWTEEKVLAFDLSISTREEVRHFRGSLQRAEFEVQRKKEGLESAISKKGETEELLRNLVEPSLKDAELLARKKKGCKELKGLESRYHLLKNEFEHINERLDDLNQERGILEETMMPGASRLPFWPIPAIIGTGFIFLIWLGLKSEWGWALGVGSLFLLSGLVLWFLKSIKNREREKGRWGEQRISQLMAKIEDLEARRKERNNELSRIQRQMTDTGAILSISGVPSRETLERMEEDLTEHVKRLERWTAITEDLEQVKKRHEEALTELQQAESGANKARSRWQEWLKDRAMEPVLSPDGAMETLSLIESCKEQTDHLDQNRSRMESLEKTRERYQSLANKVLASCNRKPVGDDEIQTAVHNLIQDFSEAELAAQKKILLLNEIKVNRQSIERFRRQSLKLQEENRKLMISGGADNEDKFRKRALTYERRTALKTEVERYEESIRRLSSTLGEMKSVMKELSKMSLEGTEEQKIRLEEELKEVEETLDRLKREQAKIEEQTRQLINDERKSVLRGEEEGLKESLSLLAEEWSTTKLAQGLVRMARVRYEKERQPEVIRSAGFFFNQLTLGKYPSIVAPIGEDSIEVVCRDNSRKKIGQLSRGTAEQLYLSLRFGFIQEFSKRSESLPVIMDEILVNFDPSRAKATVRAILDLSHEHQVLFFTCHPQMADLFREADPHIPVMEIYDGKVKKS